MDFKYKIADVAKDFGITAKRAIDTVAALTGETRKPGGTFEESEVNGLLEALTRETAVESLDEYLASGKQPEAKPAPKELWVVPRAAHAMSYHDNREEYTRRVSAFLTDCRW